MNLVIPGARPGQNSAPGGSPPKAAAATSTAADLSQLKAQMSGLTSQLGQIQATLSPPPALAAAVKVSAIDIARKLRADPQSYSLDWLHQKGIDAVLRYISSGDQAKCIDAREMAELIGAGITVGIVYELTGGSPEFGGLPGSIDSTHGASDGAYALQTLKSLGVPPGSVVYFAVDADVDNNTDINTYVIPYFTAAKQTLGGYYRIGAYGCGSTCAAALNSAGCDKAWLANATGWNGYSKFLASGRASIIQGRATDGYDPDTIVESDWAVSRRSPLQKSPEGRSHNRFWGRTWRAHRLQGIWTRNCKSLIGAAAIQSPSEVARERHIETAGVLAENRQSIRHFGPTLRFAACPGSSAHRRGRDLCVLPNRNGCGSRSGRKGITLDGDELRKGQNYNPQRIGRSIILRFFQYR